MEPRTRASLLWGMVGTLSFLVGLQAYHLLGGAFVGIGAVVGVAVCVGLVSATLAYLVRPKLRARSRR